MELVPLHYSNQDEETNYKNRFQSPLKFWTTWTAGSFAERTQAPKASLSYRSNELGSWKEQYTYDDVFPKNFTWV